MSSDSCAPMFALIDRESTLMIHGALAIPPVAPAGRRGGRRVSRILEPEGA